MWLALACGSAVFAALTTILAKRGVDKTDSTVATAVRTVIVLAFSWLMVFITGAQAGLSSLDGSSCLFLALSGLATGGSWLCYFHALKLGDVNKVTPIDKSSTILTVLLAFIVLGEPVSVKKAAALALIGVGTFLMIQRKPGEAKAASGGKWLLYALLSAVLASLTAIFAKIGVKNVDSNLATALRTCVVLVMAWLMVPATGKSAALKKIPRRELLYICLSGLATGASWLCYYRALKDGPASVVVPIDKLSIVITVAFSYFALKEKLSTKALGGLLLIVVGTLLMI